MKARTDGAVAVIDIGHERTDVVVVHAGQGRVQPQHRARRQAGHRGDRDALAAAVGRRRAREAQRWLRRVDTPSRRRRRRGRGSTSVLVDRARAVRARPSPDARGVPREAPASRRSRRSLVGGGARLRGIGSFLTEQLGIPAWRPTPTTSSRSPARSSARERAEPADRLRGDDVGMAYDAAGGRPQFDLRSGALAAKMDLSFLRAKAVPLGAAVLAIAAFAAVSAYADLYRLKKAEKTLAHAARERDRRDVRHGRRRADEVLDSTGAGGGAAALAAAEDVRLRHPARDQRQDPAEGQDHARYRQARYRRSEGRHERAPRRPPRRSISLVSELKKIDCFKEIQRGATETGEGGVKKFKLTIPSSACEEAMQRDHRQSTRLLGPHLAARAQARHDRARSPRRSRSRSGSASRSATASIAMEDRNDEVAQGARRARRSARPRRDPPEGRRRRRDDGHRAAVSSTTYLDNAAKKAKFTLKCTTTPHRGR